MKLSFSHTKNDYNFRISVRHSVRAWASDRVGFRVRVRIKRRTRFRFRDMFRFRFSVRLRFRFGFRL